ncbi:MAG: hypothetical protein EXR50_03505 [Dehalococcoidia bacterium]|nr:hypothetical protein [Dehalococcoidia bacterium]
MKGITGDITAVDSVRDPYMDIVYHKMLQGGDADLVQIWFDRAVLDKYKGASDISVIRTDTIGRISRSRIWSLDFGIAPEETLIHASLSDLVQKLPDGEKEHWAGHVSAPSVSLNFIRTRVAPASCTDDGELRGWF